MRNLDRFDRLLERATAPAPRPVSAPVVQLVTRPVHVEREPVITSTRGPRFVDHMTCPMCGVEQLGIEYQGELMSGAKVNTLAAHTPGMRRVERKQPRCLGAGVRVEFVGGVWRGGRP